MNCKLLTVAEAAEALHIRPSTVRSWVMRQRITSIRVGRCVRISTDEVEKILLAGTRAASEPQKKGGKYG
jgi:excisionase family DNA binding protein